MHNAKFWDKKLLIFGKNKYCFPRRKNSENCTTCQKSQKFNSTFSIEKKMMGKTSGFRENMERTNIKIE